jgi:glycosyltransferase involved in cell wall biosynthesis
MQTDSAAVGTFKGGGGLLSDCTITIVIPARDGENYLGLAIQSAVDQIRPADEIIVIDDASTDDTASIICRFGSRVKYIYNDTATGFVDAWNRAIEKASCDFVTILHHDDLLHQEYLAHIVKGVERYPSVRHFYSACNYMDKYGVVIKEAPLPYSQEPILYPGKSYAHNYLSGVMSNRHIHRCPGVTTSRALLLNECSYRKEAGHIADDDFFYRVGRYTDVVGISFPLASFRIHTESETAKADLTERLAADYVYQTIQTKRGDCIFDDPDKRLICKSAVKFINENLFYKLLNQDRHGIAKALGHAQQLEAIAPGIIKLNLSVWAKIMWRLTNKNMVTLSRVYVRLLDAIRHLRDFITSRKVSRVE